MKITVLLATIAVGGGLALAVAATAADQPSFDELDANGDGSISKTEAGNAKDLDFAKADTNKDGKLSRAEYEAAIG